ncbi:FdtA/QdtA family cupin domain-containing protein [Mucilaginibacter sp. BJC16-A38]|uniref:sugar 3,4-ketoisomerase n=1 Tax=Mucilaginibacter phenanthrenivorans TaxID=1234842 RepID=UPI00215872B1|nr:FdtA/QdtA family cupin domain-containing protein [Mucilaginibacter phenanthrenivorans]MCR8560197.1 FdtA/QdtA family cupin domain-containing protein [Mucilaginibacter phenanthrenivorans]
MPDKKLTVFDCNVFHLQKIHNRAGNITPVENNIHVPFDVKRVFYLYDIPGGESRAAHGHKELHQFIVAASGSFDISLDDGVNKKTVQLNRPYLGIHIQPVIWCDISNFSSGAICLVLASLPYNENGYLRDYTAFKNYKFL